MTDPQGPPPKRRLSPVAWAAIGCSVLTILALAALGSCGWMVSRFVETLGPDPRTESVEESRPALDLNATADSAADREPVALPDWMPRFSGEVRDTVLQARGPDHSGGTYSFATTDSVPAILEFYLTELTERGFTVQSSSLMGDLASSAMIGGSHAERGLGISIMVAPRDDQTTVTIHYAQAAESID